MKYAKRLLVLILIFAFILPACAFAEATAVVSVEKMLVRSGPSSDYDVLGYVPRGTQVEVIAVSEGIAKIRLNGNVGYARYQDIELQASPSPSSEVAATEVSGKTAYVASSKLNVYASASGTAKVVATLNFGASVVIAAEKNGWAQIAQGYTYRGALLSSKGTYSSEVYTASADLNVYIDTDTSSEVLGTFKKGSTVTVLAQKNSWARVENAGIVGYVRTSGLAKQAATTPTPATLSTASYQATAKSKIYVYASPDESSEKLGYLKEGEEVAVIATNASWAKVQKGSATGFTKLTGLSAAQAEATTSPTAASEKLSAVTPYQATAKGKIYVYSEAATSSSKLGYLADGEEIIVVAASKSWAQVKKGGNLGYVELAGLNLPTVQTPGTVTAVTAYEATVTNNIYVYAKASDESDCLGSLKTGETVTVLATGGKWAQVKKGEATGYTYLSGLAKVEYDTSNAKPALVGKSVKVYASYSAESDVLGSLSVGDVVNVLATSGSWARVELNGNVGYCYKSALTQVDYTTLKADSTGAAVKSLQNKLLALGFYDASVTGTYSSLTTAAVKRFQTAAGLTVSGVADVATQAKLYSSSAPTSPIWTLNLQKGSSGDSVVRLQTRLTHLGYMSSTIDGSYGSITAKAVGAYQTINGITATGSANSATLKSMFSSTAKANDGSADDKDNASNDATAAPSIKNGTKAEVVVQYAIASLDKPYIYATAGPNSFDCSGLVAYCYKQVGITLSRSAYAQGYTDGVKIDSIDKLQKGDIVCFNTVEDDDLVDHTGVYIGGGQFIHASSSAGKVIISSISGNGYYVRNFSWGRRVL